MENNNNSGKYEAIASSMTSLRTVLNAFLKSIFKSSLPGSRLDANLLAA